MGQVAQAVQAWGPQWDFSQCTGLTGDQFLANSFPSLLEDGSQCRADGWTTSLPDSGHS
jgi:hypothetical protein